MKYFILLTGLFLISLCTGAQLKDSLPAHNSGYYRAKARSQHTGAWILAGTGTVLFISGAIISYNDIWRDLGNLFDPEPEKTSNTGPVLFFTGLAGIVGSIPLFVSASKNHRIAGKLETSFKFRTITYPGLYTSAKKYYPSLAVRIRL